MSCLYLILMAHLIFSDVVWCELCNTHFNGIVHGHVVWQGVLLYGPPGTGKTLLARAVAHHTECTFIRVSGSELVQKFIGEGSRMVRELFVMAR